MRAARIAGLLAGAAAAASAFCLCANADTVTLTPEQTAALYLHDATASYYVALSDGTYQQYSLTWEILNTPTITGDGSLFIAGAYGDNSSIAQSYSTLWGSSNYVFVRLKWPTEIHVVPPVQGTNNYIQIDFDFSLTGITGFYGNILLTCGNYNRPSTNTSWAFVGQSEYRYNTTVGTIIQNTPVGTAGRPYRILTGLSQTAGLIPDDDKLYMYGSPVNTPIIDSSEPADLTSLSVIWRSPCAWGYFDHTTYDTIPSFIFAIRTPQIYGYTPPVVTTASQTTPAPTTYTLAAPATQTPAETVDLSHLESGVAAIVEQEIEINNNLEWIGENEMRAVNNLALICEKLDKIYAQMVNSGQVAIDGTFRADIDNALTSYTTARIPPEAAQGITMLGGMWALFMGYSWIAGLAVLGLALTVTYFVLFRGRNS